MDCIISVFPFSFVTSLLAFHLFFAAISSTSYFCSSGQKDLVGSLVG